MIVLAGPSFSPSLKVIPSLRFVNGKSLSCTTKIRFYTFQVGASLPNLRASEMFIDLSAPRGTAMRSFWLLILLLHFPGAVMVPPANPANDSLEKLAADFWTWRAATQPYSPDDIPRIERPGGKRDWSHAEIEKQRAALVRFDARWKKLDAVGAPAAQQVDYRLMSSALARVRWEL